MNDLPYTHLAKGSFLIASPEIDSGIYFRAVILLCEHGTAGSFGIMINKPLEIEIPEEILSTKEITNPHVHIRAGGPLQPNQMMLLHSSATVPDQTLKVCEGVYLGGDVNFLQEAMVNPEGPSVLLCFGYAGWGPGQLEREFLSGMWFLHPANNKDIFENPPEKAWQTILRSMGGKFATLSMIPEDLSLN